MNTAFRVSSENIIADWGYVEDWTAGDSVAPTGWVMSGTAGSVAKESSTIKYGTYSMKIISGSSNSYKAGYSIDDYDDYEGRTVKFGMWVYCGTASKARIYIYDGTTTTNSSYHTGGGDWEFLEVEAQVGASNTELTFGCEVQSSTITAYFDGGIAIEGDTIFTELSNYIEDWKPILRYKNSKFDIARKDGILIPKVKRAERMITVQGNVTGSTITACRTTYDSIIKSVNGGKKDFYLYDDRLIKGYVTSHKHDYLASLRMIKFNWIITCPEPYWRYIGRLRHSEAISSSPTSFNFEYNGNIESFPVVKFTQSGNALSSCTLENLTTGQSMSFSGTVADGDVLEINCDTLLVENDGTDSVDDFSGDFIKLIPGTNYMKFTGSNTTITIDWFDKWL